MLPFCDNFKGEKVLLRKIKSSDAEVWASWFNDSEVLKYSRHRSLRTSPEKQLIIMKNIHEDPSKVQFICEFRKRPVGVISLIFYDNIDAAEISVIIGEKSSWGMGIASDSIKTIIDYCKKFHKVNKFFAGCDNRNIGSVKAFQKCGFKIKEIEKNSIKYPDEETLYDKTLMVFTSQEA